MFELCTPSMSSASNLQRNLISRIAIGDIFRRRGKDKADEIAVSQNWANGITEISYRKLNDRLNQFVHALRAKGLQKGDKVAILGSNSINYYIALLGCYKGGFVAVPVNYLISQVDLYYIIKHAESKAVFFDASLADKVENIVEELKPLVTCNLVGSESSASSLEGFLNGHDSSEIEDVIIDDDDAAHIVYTSGTTALPKGVVASHKSIFLSSINTFMLANIKPSSTNQYVALPLFHLTALTFSLLTLHCGGKVVLVDGFEPEKAVALFDKEKINVAVLIPTMWRAILNSTSIKQHDLSSLECAFYGMTPMDQTTLQMMKDTFGGGVVLASGQTEIGGACTALDDKWALQKQGNYWGDGSVFCDQAVMDDEGKLLPPNEVGEIVWRSPLVMNGYFKNEVATDESRQYGWHHSGDLGFIDDDNQLCFVDRKKDIIKSGGENVSSVLIEEVLLDTAGVENAAVFGVPHARWGEAVVAAVVIAGAGEGKEEKFSEGSLISRCKDMLGGFQVPKRILFVDKLPTTATGKLQKAELRKQFQSLFDEE